MDDELVKIVRNQTPRDQPTSDSDFTHGVISGVRFAPLVSYPAMDTVIPARIWNPSIHKFFPETFKSSCKELLLCSHAQYDQPARMIPPKVPVEPVNVASMLPRALWMEVLSYAHRDCKFCNLSHCILSLLLLLMFSNAIIFVPKGSESQNPKLRPCAAA